MAGLAELETLGFVESIPVEWLDELQALGYMEPLPGLNSHR